MSQPLFTTPLKASLSIPLPEFDDSPGSGVKRSPRGFPISPQGDGLIPTLPLFGSIPRITGDTLISIISGKYSSHFQNYFIIDCRYSYEYEGGHIKNAVNCNDPDIFTSAFFEDIQENTIIIFHCEFSQNRGPQMAQIFRDIDREINKTLYPYLYYPNVYILDGGYSKFYSNFPDYCDGGYVKMFDEVHKTNGDLIRETNFFRQNVHKIERHASLSSFPEFGSYNETKSPYLNSKYASPISTRIQSYFASPVIPRQFRGLPRDQ